MAIEVTLSEFKAYLPEFEELEDRFITPALMEAGELTKISKMTVMLAAAHIIILERQQRALDKEVSATIESGTSDTETTDVSGSNIIKRRKVGDIEIEYANQSQSSTVRNSAYVASLVGRDRLAYFGQSVYGQRMLSLERRNARVALPRVF